MKNLRLLTIATIAGLTIFFNIERLDFGRTNLVDIDSFVYILGAIALTSVIMTPLLWRSHVALSLTLWITVYLLMKLFLFNQRPLLGGLYTYLTTTEIALLLLTIWLSHSLGRALQDFEKAVENITFGSGNKRVRRLDDATEDIQVEMFRSRHHHHPLGVIVVEPDPNSVQTALHETVKEVQQTMLKGYLLNSLARELSNYLRRTDLVLEQRDQGRFVVMCPDTNVKDLTVLSEYIQNFIAKKVGVSVTCGTATFPVEALTFEELVRQAESRLSHPTLPDISSHNSNSSFAPSVQKAS